MLRYVLNLFLLSSLTLCNSLLAQQTTVPRFINDYLVFELGQSRFSYGGEKEGRTYLNYGIGLIRKFYLNKERHTVNMGILYTRRGGRDQSITGNSTFTMKRLEVPVTWNYYFRQREGLSAFIGIGLGASALMDIDEKGFFFNRRISEERYRMWNFWGILELGTLVLNTMELSVVSHIVLSGLWKIQYTGSTRRFADKLRLRVFTFRIKYPLVPYSKRKEFLRFE